MVGGEVKQIRCEGFSLGEINDNSIVLFWFNWVLMWQFVAEVATQLGRFELASNAASEREIIFTRGTTEAINLVSYAWAAPRLQPGDEIVLANGTWNNTRLLLKGNGTAAAPITLRAQSPGQVVLTGQSDLRLAGQYLHVANLVFRNGYSLPGFRSGHYRMGGRRKPDQGGKEETLQHSGQYGARAPARQRLQTGARAIPQGSAQRPEGHR